MKKASNPSQHTDDFQRACKRLTNASITTADAMKSFGRVAKILKSSMPSNKDWNKNFARRRSL